MKLKFDSNQAYQWDAVNAVVDLFDGQPLNQSDFEVAIKPFSTSVWESVLQTTLGVGNNLLLSDEALLKNLHQIQERNDLENIPELAGYNFSVEMETGTGKTYVYLRTIFELSQRYGFKKFIIVVPSVAIREGVLKNLQITEEHFKSLYNNVPLEYFVYDGKKTSKLRQFAASNQIQIMIINIDAFRKNFTGTEEDVKSNVIYKESDKLSGRQPIEFVQVTRPIVIIDEPQSVDSTEKAQEAIKALNPLCTLRYSATHKNPYNLVYKLDPIRAYELRLVKQIVVASVVGSDSHNGAYLKLLKVENKNGIKAEVQAHVNTSNGIKEKKLTLKQNDDLFERTVQRETYRDGFIVTEITTEPGNEYIEFNNGIRLNLGQEIGGVREDLSRVQIKNTIQKHLEREKQLKDRGIKVLSLFFIDKVANYRSYDEQGNPKKGKYAQWFEEFYHELIQKPQYQGILPYPVEKLHDGYFAEDKNRRYKDSSEGRSTSQDDEIYNKIMRNKEVLLSSDEPLRFIFSHSALREGWDNPNVFQICTLNETRSTLKKRQEIGRGLRLPVNQQGERVFDENINKLLVIANESYEDFARTLQTEYEEDCGVTFGKILKIGFSKLLKPEGEEQVCLGKEASEQIWESLQQNGYISREGHILPKFNPKEAGFSLELPQEYVSLKSEIIDTLESYRIEKHIRKDEDKRPLRVNKQVFLDPEFEALWNRIKAKTTYSVDYSTEMLITNAVKAIGTMQPIEPVKVSYREALLGIEHKGVEATEIRNQITKVSYEGSLPDILAFLQKETELTRETIVKILITSGRIGDFAVNPQKFMDAVSTILKNELHRLMIDGIKYERISDSDYSMRLFEDKEVISYLTNRQEVQKSVYDAVVYDSEVERKFAEDLNSREDIKLFVKLPGWFTVDTPIGKYNPDWAILKHDDTVLYLVRETKSTKNFTKLRNSETDKIHCGRRHFEVLGVDFDVVTSAVEV